MKITSSNNTAIVGVTPKVVETGNGFLINSQYYTKEKLAVVPMEFLRLAGSPYALSTTKQLFLQAQSWRFPNDEVEIYKDSTYPNRYYMRVTSGYVESSSMDTTLVTLEEAENKEIRCLNTTLLKDKSIVDFLDQDENNIYIQVRESNATTIYTLNKSTFVLTSRWNLSSQSYGYVKLTKLYSDETNIYMMYFFNQNIYTLVYNKASQTHTLSQAIYRGEDGADPMANIFTVISDTPYEVDGNTSGLFLINSMDAQQPIDLYTYDRSKPFTEGFTMTHVNIVWNDIKSQVNFSVGLVNNMIRLFISEFDGVKYLNLVSYNTTFTTSSYIPNQGVYTFRIDSPEQLTFTGFNHIDETKLIGGFIYDASKEHLIVSKLNAFQILKFNKETLAYEDTSLEISGCYSVGLDELQRIWYIKTDSSTHMVNMEDAQSVDIKFEKQYYEYTGTSINTYVTFSALNYLGEPFKGTFELTLDGPAIFTENGNNKITFNYDGEGVHQININIIGASPITVYPKFIKTI